MTVGELLGAMRRRWYVMLAVAAVAAIAVVYLAQDGGIYSTRTVVTLRYAQAAVVAPDNGMGVDGVITFAGTIAAQINGGRPVPRYASSDAPYYGAGIRQGEVVGLRDEGNQWAPQYTSAMIEIQVVGRTEDWVEERQSSLLSEIDAIVAARQLEVVDKRERIVAEVEPLSTGIEHIVSGRSAFAAAVGAMGVVVLIVGGLLATMVDRWRGGRARHRTNEGLGALGGVA
jgi:hypothetical protein